MNARPDARADASNPSAPAGKARKYARPELERRFLLERRLPGDVVQTAQIIDRYLRGTRLRVRETIEQTASDARTAFKLTQKVPGVDGGPGLITTMYLDAAEHAALSRIPADVLRKTRLGIPPFGVDVFDAPLHGLVLAEVEFDTEEERRAFTPAIPFVAEITTDIRFTGGRLATASRAEVASDLLEFGIELAP